MADYEAPNIRRATDARDFNRTHDQTMQNDRESLAIMQELQSTMQGIVGILEQEFSAKKRLKTLDEEVLSIEQTSNKTRRQKMFEEEMLARKRDEEYRQYEAHEKELTKTQRERFEHLKATAGEREKLIEQSKSEAKVNEAYALRREDEALNRIEERNKDLERLIKRETDPQKKADYEAELARNKGASFMQSDIGRFLGKQFYGDKFEEVISDNIEKVLDADEGEALQLEAFTGVFDDKFTDLIGVSSKVLGVVGQIPGLIIKGINAFDAYVDSAANFIAANKGQMNAALYGWTGLGQSGAIGSDYYDALSNKIGALTTSSLLSETSYLQEVRNLATQGIADNVEMSAMLQAVAEKTVPHFSATEGYVRRLVLLGEQQSAEKFFGLESILTKSLNAQFGESSYLNALFDSVNSNLMDAMNNLSAEMKGMRMPFLSTTQSWMSALYESGVDSGVINSLSSAINALGSGNISGMSSNSGMQKLLLLSMDRAGLDYATLLQNGLDTESVNILLGSMVQYLNELSRSTMANNVLESAYANMFGLSMSDMYALSNFNLEAFNPIALTSDNAAITEMSNRLGGLGSGDAYVSASEKVTNVLDNLKFAFGNKLAMDQTKYFGWKGGQLATNLGMGLIGSGHPVAGASLTAIGGGAMLMSVVNPLVRTLVDVTTNVTDYLTEGTNSVQQLYEAVGAGYTSPFRKGQNYMIETNLGKIKELKDLSDDEKFKSDLEMTEEQYKDMVEAEDESLSVLKELEKTFMKNTNDNYAIAVSLQGVGNEALKSFASIFADEDAMKDVFTAKGKNKLFNYDAKDTTSGDNKGTPQAGLEKVTDGNSNHRV